MPITKKSDGWYWGGQGPFDSRSKAEDVAQAAHASGYNKMDKAYGEPYKTEKFDQKQNKRTMQAGAVQNMEKEGLGGGAVATTGMTGDAGTGNSIFTETYGGDSGKRRKKKNKNSKNIEALLNFIKEDLDGDDLTTFTTAYVEDGYPEETDNKKKTKKRSGIERAGTFLDDFSPKMEKDEDTTEQYKKNRRRHTQELIGTASPTPNTDTIPTQSHKTTFFHKDSLVLDLINYARVELQKGKNTYKAPTATGAGKETRLMTNDPMPPFVNEADNGRKGIRDGITPSKHTPAAQGVDENNVVNMGHAGNLEEGKNINDVQNDFYSTGRVSKPPRKKKNTPNGVFIATQNNPTQIEAMQKYSPQNFHTTHPTRQEGENGTIEHPQRSFIEYDGNIMERVKKHKKAHEERNADTTEGFISAMEKGGDAYGMGSWDGQNDSLKRGGDLDTLDNETIKELHRRRLAKIKDWSNK